MTIGDNYKPSAELFAVWAAYQQSQVPTQRDPPAPSIKTEATDGTTDLLPCAPLQPVLMPLYQLDFIPRDPRSARSTTIGGPGPSTIRIKSEPRDDDGLSRPLTFTNASDTRLLQRERSATLAEEPRPLSVRVKPEPRDDYEMPPAPASRDPRLANRSELNGVFPCQITSNV